jgi:deoxyadenosine/deoxycytidine kinase
MNFLCIILTVSLLVPPLCYGKIVVSIEGNTGAGKTTLTSMIQEQWHDVHVIKEPFDQWQSINGGQNLFKTFIQDKERWSFTYQTWAFFTNLFPLTHENRHEITIVDRSLLASQNCFVKMQYQEGNLSQLEFDLFNEQARMIRTLLPHKLNGIIYLRSTPEVAQQRTMVRNRDLKDGVEISWFQNLHNVHEEWLIEKKDLQEDIKDIPVLIIDGNVDFQYNKQELDKILNQIRAFIEGLKEGKVESFIEDNL